METMMDLPVVNYWSGSPKQIQGYSTHLVILGKTPQVSGLHLQQIMNRCLTNANHGNKKNKKSVLDWEER
jgi:hypothetical protein